MKSDFLIALTQLAAEKNLPREIVFDAVEAALASAYKRDGAPNAVVSVKVNHETGDARVFRHRTVVEEVENPDEEITLKEARRIQPDLRLGESLVEEMQVRDPGRIQAQTAKQVVLQRLREAEREVVYNEYIGKENDVISGVVQRLEGRNVILDLGKTEALLPGSEQVRIEHYRPTQRIKVLLVRVEKAARGPQVIVSRAHRDLIRRLFELEVPEIHKGTVEIKSIAREPGFRSKVAVWSRQDGIDPVGACVGLRGLRIQNVVNELGGERIDVVQWDPDPAKFVAHALSPARVIAVSTDDEANTATVVVPDHQLSLAIGKEGQNARLAAKLTGWRIDIKSETMAEQAAAGDPDAPEAVAQTAFSAPAPDAAEVAALREAAAIAAAPVPVLATPEIETEDDAELEEELVAVAPAAPPMPVTPVGPSRSGIRFAEEVVAPDRPLPPADNRPVRRRPDGSRRDDREDEAARARRAAATAGKRGRRPVTDEEEDDSDPYAEYAAKFR